MRRQSIDMAKPTNVTTPKAMDRSTGTVVGFKSCIYSKWSVMASTQTCMHAPLAQPTVSHSLISISQYSPVKPLKHKQENSPTPSTQVPLLQACGFNKHWSISVWQFLPVKSTAQIHFASIIPTFSQVAPFKQRFKAHGLKNVSQKSPLNAGWHSQVNVLCVLLQIPPFRQRLPSQGSVTDIQY